MPATDPNEFVQYTARAFITGEPDDAQDRFAEFVVEHAEDDATTDSVMDLINTLDNARRKIAFDAVVAVILSTPRASVMHQKGLEKWDELVERIASDDIFRALDWAALPCLWSDQFESLHAAGLKKWQQLLTRASVTDFDRTLRYAREMEDSDPTRPFATVARLAADALEKRKPNSDAPRPPSL